MEIRVISRRDGIIVSGPRTVDITRHFEEIKAREARHDAKRPTRVSRSDDSIIKEIAWKICGPDFDADDAEANRWTVEVIN